MNFTIFYTKFEILQWILEAVSFCNSLNTSNFLRKLSRWLWCNSMHSFIRVSSLIEVDRILSWKVWITKASNIILRIRNWSESLSNFSTLFKLCRGSPPLIIWRNPISDLLLALKTTFITKISRIIICKLIYYVLWRVLQLWRIYSII